MAITEAQAGSDAAAIQTTAVFDEDQRVGAERHQDLLHRRRGRARVRGRHRRGVGDVDKSAGRAGIKSFVVTAGTPGVKVVGCEKKLGIRASDTATLVLEDCRVPADHLLGKAEVKKQDPSQAGDKGFKGAMATFDASRPIVAAMAVGVGRAALDFVKEELERQGVAIRYDAPPREQTAIERDVIEMEAELQAARLLTWRAAKMMTAGSPTTWRPRWRRPRRASPSPGSRRRRWSCSGRSATRRSCWSRSGCATPRSTTSTRAPSRSTS
jgi:acyl-CoA dehydrogenase